MSPMRSALGTGVGAAVATAATRLKRERAVLVVIDLQERLLPVVFERERVLRNALLLIHAARALEIPLLVTTQYRKGLGEVVAEVREAASGSVAIDKLSFGAFGDEAFVEWFIQRPGRDQLLVCGIESHVCVLQTVMGGVERGLTLHVAADAVGARQEANWRLGLSRMERLGATITSAEMAVYELLERADDEAFRKLLPLLKAGG
jgi:nicotinamidase-related amidase